MRKPQTARVVGVDLFCGAGGVTCGMRRAGVDVKLGIDSEVRFSKTYELNNAPAVYWCRDITGVAGLEISNAIALLPSQKFFLSACAPCQPFSRHNKRGVLRGHQDERSDLLDEVGRILCEFSRKPDYIFVENVPGISTKMDSALKRFEQTLFDLKYSTVSGVIDAAKYGVPQHRRRFILVAKLGISYVSLPLETHGPGRQFGYETVEAIRRYPAVGAGETNLIFPNHQSRRLSQINLDRIREIPKDGGSRESLTGELVLKCHKKALGHKDVYGRLAWQRPAPTITTRCVSLSNGRFGHPDQDRALTVREAARLQSFPDDYEFFGTGIDSQAKQVGNAVPVLLAEIITRNLVA